MDKTLEHLTQVTGALQSILDHNLVPEPQAAAARARVKLAGEHVNEQLNQQTQQVKRWIAAVDVLKAAVSNDRCTMVSTLERYKRAVVVSTLTPDAIGRKVAELALDILCGEQPV
jgi:hypothetical protein